MDLILEDVKSLYRKYRIASPAGAYGAEGGPAGSAPV